MYCELNCLSLLTVVVVWHLRLKVSHPATRQVEMSNKSTVRVTWTKHMKQVHQVQHEGTAPEGCRTHGNCALLAAELAGPAAEGSPKPPKDPSWGADWPDGGAD